jgi:DNA-binding response OmpR family regulator
LKILVAEDEAEIAKSYKLVLEKRKHEVTLTLDGEECIKAYKERLSSGKSQNPFDLVLLDYKMPKKGGFEVAKEILSLRSSQRILVASASSPETLVESLHALHSGIGIIQKPFQLKDLIYLVEYYSPDPQNESLDDIPLTSVIKSSQERELQ